MDLILPMRLLTQYIRIVEQAAFVEERNLYGHILLHIHPMLQSLSQRANCFILVNVERFSHTLS